MASSDNGLSSNIDNNQDYYEIEHDYLNDSHNNLDSNSYGWLDALYGTIRKDFLVYTGMWSYHPDLLFRDRSEDYTSNNKTFGFLYSGYFASRFKNSYNDTSYMLGIQRDWLQKKLYYDLDFDAGYRLGMIYGYKVGTTPMAKYSKVLPFFGLHSSLTYNFVGIEAAVNAYVISGSFFWAF